MSVTHLHGVHEIAKSLRIIFYLYICFQLEVAFTEASYTYNENEPGAEFCIFLRDGEIQPGQTIKVGYGSVGVNASKL